MRNNQSWPAVFLDDIGDRERLPRSGDTEQGLELLILLEAFEKLPDSFRLVALGLVFRGQFKIYRIRLYYFLLGIYGKPLFSFIRLRKNIAFLSYIANYL